MLGSGHQYKETNGEGHERSGFVTYTLKSKGKDYAKETGTIKNMMFKVQVLCSVQLFLVNK